MSGVICQVAHITVVGLNFQSKHSLPLSLVCITCMVSTGQKIQELGCNFEEAWAALNKGRSDIAGNLHPRDQE